LTSPDQVLAGRGDEVGATDIEPAIGRDLYANELRIVASTQHQRRRADHRLNRAASLTVEARAALTTVMA
jgi:hypothetical protein